MWRNNRKWVNKKVGIKKLRLCDKDVIVIVVLDFWMKRNGEWLEDILFLYMDVFMLVCEKLDGLNLVLIIKRKWNDSNFKVRKCIKFEDENEIYKELSDVDMMNLGEEKWVENGK